MPVKACICFLYVMMWWLDWHLGVQSPRRRRYHQRARCVAKAKFHYTDTNTDFFATKRTRTDPTEFRYKKVRVRVVEFSYKWWPKLARLPPRLDVISPRLLFVRGRAARACAVQPAGWRTAAAASRAIVSVIRQPWRSHTRTDRALNPMHSNSPSACVRACGSPEPRVNYLVLLSICHVACHATAAPRALSFICYSPIR